MDRVNVRQIARQAGVSPSTVSVVLNRAVGVPVSESTRRKVLHAAEKMGYQRSSLARAIKTPLRHLGIAVGDLDIAQQTFTALIFQGIHDHLLGRNYRPVMQRVPLFLDQPDPERFTAPLIELYESRLIDGLILDKQYFLDVAVHRLLAAGVPLVMVNGGLLKDVQGRPVPSVTIDDYQAGFLATRHLLELGHRSIGLIGRPYEQGPRAFRSSPVYQFRSGYQAALRQAGIEPHNDLMAEGDLLDKTATYAAVEYMTTLGTRPTAFVAGDDQIAVMALNALRRLGLSVPRDASVVGYGNLSMVERLVEPALTTVNAPLRENGRQAAAMLLALLETQPSPPPRHLVLPPQLVPGQTSAKP